MVQKDALHRSGTELLINCQIVYGKKLMVISAVGMLSLEETFCLLESFLRGESTV